MSYILLDNLNFLKEFCIIFDKEFDIEEIKKYLYILENRKKLKDDFKILEKNTFNRNFILANYHSEYENILIDLFNHSEDFTFIKQVINKISTNYYQIFALNHIDFYYKMLYKAPLAIFAVLMNESLRNFFLISARPSNNDPVNALFIEN